MPAAPRYSIHVAWSAADDAWVARVPALPGCAAHGDSAAEAVSEAEQAADLIVDAMREYGDPLPAEEGLTSYSGNIRLRLPRSLHARLDALAYEEGVSLNQLMVAFLSERAGYRAAEKKHQSEQSVLMAREGTTGSFAKRDHETSAPAKARPSVTAAPGKKRRARS
jgi:antitoxin HicB